MNESFDTKLIAAELKSVKEFTILYLGIEVIVRYNYFGFTKNLNDDKLPIISHIDFRCSKNFRSFTTTGYKSYFFNPNALVNYLTVEKVATDILDILFEEFSLVSEIEIKENNTDFQLSLF
jgi:hypothetical protein